MGIKTRFCAKCGKETERLHEGLCPSCYFESRTVKLPRRITLYVCPVCDSINWKGLWLKTEHPHEYYLQLLVLDEAKVPGEVEIEDAKIMQEDRDGRVELTLNVLGKKFTQVLPIELYVDDKRCIDCAKRLSDVREAILQLRTIRGVEGFISAVIPTTEKFKSHIIKIAEQKHGIDIYMSSREAARHLAAELKKQFSLKIKETFEEYSWDKMKNRPKSRVNILMQRR